MLFGGLASILTLPPWSVMLIIADPIYLPKAIPLVHQNYIFLSNHIIYFLTKI